MTENEFTCPTINPLADKAMFLPVRNFIVGDDPVYHFFFVALYQ